MEVPLYNFVVFDGFCYCVTGISLGGNCSTSQQDLCVTVGLVVSNPLHLHLVSVDMYGLNISSRISVWNI